MFDWVLNTPLVYVYSRKGLQNVNIYLLSPKTTSKFVYAFMFSVSIKNMLKKKVNYFITEVFILKKLVY